MDQYRDKLEREQRWYTHSTFNPRHFLNSRLFFSSERNAFNYVLPRTQLFRWVGQALASDGLEHPRMLIAPIGTGDDLPYVRPSGAVITGIDISPDAVAKISDPKVETHVGDLKQMSMFADDSFDVVVVPLFFHHFLKFGFEPFLDEARRVLRPAGHFFSLEPNSLHPVCQITWVVKRMVGNIMGAVEDEAPLNPVKLCRSMRRCGFRNVEVRGASFCHNRIPIWAAKVINPFTLPCLEMPGLKCLAWMCAFHGRK